MYPFLHEGDSACLKLALQPGQIDLRVQGHSRECNTASRAGGYLVRLKNSELYCLSACESRAIQTASTHIPDKVFVPEFVGINDLGVADPRREFLSQLSAHDATQKEPAEHTLTRPVGIISHSLLLPIQGP